MDGRHDSKSDRRRSDLRRLLFLWLLAGLQFTPVLSTDEENEPSQSPDNTSEEGLEVIIAGPDYVTVGVPCSFQCVSNCPPSSSCTYFMAVDQQRAQGQGTALDFTLRQWAESLTVSCTVTDDVTGASESAAKKPQVLAGPANVSIAGPAMINAMAGHSYSCHAYCRPSCNYTWRLDKGPWVGGQRNVMSVTPQEKDTSKTLSCKATNSVSGLFAVKVQDITVASGPSAVSIQGPDTTRLFQTSTFTCTAECVPSCHYQWTVGDHTLRGSQVYVTVEHPLKSVTLKCEAQNTVSRRSSTVWKTMWVGDHSAAPQPEETSPLLLGALLFYTLTIIRS